MVLQCLITHRSVVVTTDILYGINSLHNSALDMLFSISMESIRQIVIIVRVKGENDVDVLHPYNK